MALVLVLPDHTRVAVVDVVTIGRAPHSTLRLINPSVSCVDARISPVRRGVVSHVRGQPAGIADELMADAEPELAHDSSTNALIRRYGRSRNRTES